MCRILCWTHKCNTLWTKNKIWFLSAMTCRIKSNPIKRRNTHWWSRFRSSVIRTMCCQLNLINRRRSEWSTAKWLSFLIRKSITSLILISNSVIGASTWSRKASTSLCDFYASKIFEFSFLYNFKNHNLYWINISLNTLNFGWDWFQYLNLKL